MQNKITPFFWFPENLKDALAYYDGIFNREGNTYFKQLSYQMINDMPGHSVEMATVELFGNTYHFMGAKQYVEFTDAISLMISTEDQAETDYYWDAFTKEGKESACGWCKDKYGLSWQVTPKRLMELNSSPDLEVAQYSISQMMKMGKIIIKDLERQTMIGTPPKNDWINPKIEIRETPGKGKGAFAVDTIFAGEEVVIWGGEYVDKIEAEKAEKEGKLVMQFDEDLFSIEDRGVSDAYFINHSCEPNLWMKNTFTIEAMRDIASGEELTADYAMWETDENYISKWSCACGTKKCRGKVTGLDFKIEELQKAYKDHFIPFLNKKINHLIKSLEK